MKRLLSITFLSLLLSSCALISINGSFQGLYGYYEKANKQCPALFVHTGNSLEYCNTKPEDSTKIIIRNGTELKKCIEGFDKVVVYLWSPKCKGKFCPALDLLQKRCDEKNIALFIVAEYYDAKLMQKKYHINRFITGIDTKYYRTNRTSKYLLHFIDDLTGKSKTPTNNNRILYFEKGMIVKAVKSMDEI